MDAPDTLSYSVAPGDLRTINHRLERISQTIQHLRQKIECNAQTTSSHCGEAEKEDGNNLVGEGRLSTIHQNRQFLKDIHVSESLMQKTPEMTLHS